ncbi:hypothetical protein Tel_09095 [Candidatus Tenderia electrophaga]|jgi:hypothetical protein|uniref:PNPLA domain-containing protein n=1 Tax=Candidatus Tenderia electrophaga TaxID=1748243 RepID=A0A0S2TDU5_9GAMM|nr:hypothetical protein Tel_09095 [Candidatus Tenderia electrophaga]
MDEHAKDFDQIHQDELERIKERRRLAGQDEGDPAVDAVGLALSGGGVRSATFNLGLLQALHRCGLLKRVDYLSTVSGGGFIGASLTWFMSYLGRDFPFGTSRQDRGSDILYWLRARGKYLTPGDGLTVWALIGAILTGTLVSLLVLVPVFLLLFVLLINIDLGTAPFFPTVDGRHVADNNLFAWLFTLGVLVLAGYLVYSLVFAVSTRWPAARRCMFQRKVRERAGLALMLAGLALVLGTLPLVYQYLAQHAAQWLDAIMSSVSLSGVVSLFAGFKGSKNGNEAKGGRSVLLSLGLSLLVYGVFLWFYHLTWHMDNIGWLGAALLLSLILALNANINHVSMHRFYRNRLMEAYLPCTVAGVPQEQADACLLHEIPQTAAPYHLINTNIQLVGSDTPEYKERGGDGFILSPLYCGAPSTGYVPSSEYVGGSLNLATAFAISGAAVAPNTYATRSRPLIFLMTLLNVRLGYWIRNPRRPATKMGKWSRPWWYIYMFRELTGRFLNEKRMHIHLSDGGHFENLGLYELIRRRCRYIIVADAAADPDWTFRDLSQVIQRVRVDFGARVELDTAPLQPDPVSGRSEQAFIHGRITYVDGSEAELLFVTTTLIDGLPEDIYGYRRAHPSYPDESTGDQFFDEAQFEAYRELGFQIGHRLCNEDDDEPLAAAFRRAHRLKPGQVE